MRMPLLSEPLDDDKVNIQMVDEFSWCVRCCHLLWNDIPKYAPRRTKYLNPYIKMNDGLGNKFLTMWLAHTTKGNAKSMYIGPENHI